MQYDILEELRKLANILDEGGFGKHADQVDGFMGKFADELGTGEGVLKDMQSGGRAEQIERQMAEQMGGGTKPTPEAPGGKLPGPGRNKGLTGPELVVEMDKNPAFKRAMIMKLQQSVNEWFTTPEEQPTLKQWTEYLSTHGKSLTSAQIAEFLGQFGLSNPE